MINATMNIRMVPLHEIKPYDNNVKQHPVRQLEAIVQSIKSFGFRQPLVIDRNKTIICGHARYEAATAIGMEIVPCELVENLSEEQISAYRILDNEIAAQGYTDLIKLNVELEKLPNFNFVPFNVAFDPVNVDLDVPVVNEEPKSEKPITCPSCEHVFYKSEVKNG